MLYYLYIEYTENGIIKILEKFFNSSEDRYEFVKKFRKRRK